ncbi:MAG: DUF3097 family protein, partial [Actinomycetota bacterium]
MPRVVATPGLVVEVASADFVGTVVSCARSEVTLEDRRGRRRVFGLSPGAFYVDDRAVSLIPVPESPRTASSGPATTNSGSIPVLFAKARVARASRLLVEGIHDAELVEQVWGDDLRVEGVVVD